MMGDELARPARLASVLKILASAGYLAALFTVSDAYPQLFAGVVFVPLAALTVVRHLRVLTLKPYLRATPTHLHVKIWDTRFMVPWAFEETRTVPWSAISGATVHTLRVNGMASSSLKLAVGSSTVDIEPGVFAEDAHELQRRVLDRVVPAQRAEARVPEVSARAQVRAVAPVASEVPRRGTAPRVLRNDSTPVPAAIAYAVTVAVAAGGVLSEQPWFLWGGVALIALIFALGMTGRYAMERKVRHVELRADGLWVGPSERELTAYPWEAISHAMTTVTNGVPHGVRVALHDGRQLVLHGKYGIPFEELRELIDPAR